ncbi:MAG: archaetidylserine decarboxylase [Wenzhouxiangellaceae bacterium]
MLLEKLKVLPQYLLPQKGLTRLANAVSNSRLLARPMIAGFQRVFDVSLDEYRVPGAGFETFDAFFTRALKPDARMFPEDIGVIACPCDGAVSQLGDLNAGRLIQAKGRDYALTDLLGADDWARALDGGRFATIYLAPFDYHRVHMPFAARLVREVRIPGRLFSVSHATTRHVDRLFARNERMVALCETDYGPAAVVMVAAMLVAGIETAWDGIAQTRPGAVPETRDLDELRLARGDEIGCFHWGSTVIVVTPPGAPAWRESLAPGQRVRLGQPLTGAN